MVMISETYGNIFQYNIIKCARRWLQYICMNWSDDDDDDDDDNDDDWWEAWQQQHWVH